MGLSSGAGLPIFDLILLGIGPDGHVASLFPNHKQVSVTKGWILPVDDSPKPPAERISLSLSVINRYHLQTSQPGLAMQILRHIVNQATTIHFLLMSIAMGDEDKISQASPWEYDHCL